MATKYCPNCGAPNNGPAPFCGNCGTNVFAAQSTQPVSKPVAPPTPPAPPAPVRVPPVYNGQKKKRSAGVVVLCVFLSIIMVISSAAAMMIAGVRNMMSAKTVERIAHTVICSDSFLDIPAHNMVQTENRDISIMEYLMQSMFLVGGQNYDFNQYDFRIYLEESNLIRLFCKETGKLVQDIRDGTYKSGITTDELYEAIYADQALIEQRLYLRLSDDDISFVVYNLEASGLTELFNHEKGNNFAFDILEDLVSRTNLIIFLSVAILCLLIILFATKFDWAFLTMDAGISFVIAGGFACLPGLLDGAIRTLLSLPMSFLPVVTRIMDLMTIQLILPGLVEALLGVCLIVVSVIIHTKKKKTQ